MRLSKTFLIFLNLIMLLGGSSAQQRLEYPKAPKTNQIDDFFGTKISDPYRWLENSDSPETKQWIESQNKSTDSYLASIPERNQIKARLTELWNYERFSVPIKAGNHYFYFKNDGLQNQNVLYIADSINDKGRVLFDPNKLSTDGTVSLADLSISNDGKLIAYSLSFAGSDWREWRFREVKTEKDLPDVLKHIKQSNTSWSKDTQGVFYLGYPPPDEKSKLQAPSYNKKLYYHKLGTPQSEDVVVYERLDDKELGMDCSVSEDGRWLIIYVGKGQANTIFYKDLSEKDSTILPLVDKFESNYSYGFIGNIGAILYFRTNREAPNRKIVAIDVSEKEKKWRDIVPQSNETFRISNIVNRQIILGYLKDAYTQVRIFDLKGNFISNLDLPGIGTALGFSGRSFDTETFYSFSNFATPQSIYRYDLKTGKNKIFRQPKIKFNPNDYQVKQIFYKSKDGTKIPMFIVHKKGIKFDRNNPTLLYGYGGYGVSITPIFSVSKLVWLEMGGVYAVANLRGGGEYGEEWHQAATKLNRQKTFDDFIAAAEWLISNNYTQSKKLAINGNSFGGLLVGATLNQRPDLFGAAVPEVGVMDMLRFHKFTGGKGWVAEFGSPEIVEEFKTVFAYSPLHNIKKDTEYPAVLATTADHDDRVIPAHSYKYVATLQEAQSGNAPILIRIETNAGHGDGKPTSKIIQEQADVYGFLVKNLEIKINRK